MSGELKGLTEVVRRFADARGWEGAHTPKNLAMALAAESGELLSEFMWLTPLESIEVMAEPRKATRVSEEVADVMIYLLRLADVLGIDLSACVSAKMTRNDERFSIDAEAPH